VLLGGCGGEARLSRAAYVAKLDAMCRDFSARERTIGEPVTAADVAARGGRIAAAFDAAIRDPARRLRPPAALARVDASLRQLNEALSANLHALAAAARSNDPVELARLATSNRQLNARANRISAGIGACRG